MMGYERFTKQNQEPKTIFCFSGSMQDFKIYKRLQELEDKIEQGTLKEIPENAVVLTREEYEELKQAKILLEFREETIKYLEEANIRYSEALENKSKETAKECYEKMLEDCPIICDEEHTYSEFVKHYKNWLKEHFGVEME